MKTLYVKRVAYGKLNTPKEMQEFKIVGLNNSPVGCINEIKDWAREHKYTEVDFENLDGTHFKEGL